MSISTRVSIAWPPEFPPEETTDTLVLSFPSGYFIDLRFVRNASQETLEWGFAGRMETSGNTTTFIHMIDSRVPQDPLSVQDSGQFEILPNGDERETGEMLNPVTGRMMAYEEIWRKLAASGSKDALCLESVDDEEPKLFIGRVAARFQGVCVRGGRVSAVRCSLDEKGQRRELYRIGEDVDMMLAVPMELSIGWHSGQTVTLANRQWLIHDCMQ